MDDALRTSLVTNEMLAESPTFQFSTEFRKYIATSHSTVNRKFFPVQLVEMANSTMDEFCGTTFWSSNLTWYTEDPDLTACFQKTVLVWVPCVFLWTFSVFEVFYILNSKKRDIPWNFLNILKSAVTAVLIILTAVDLITSLTGPAEITVYNVDIYTPLIKIFTFILTAVFLIYNKKHGLRTSGLLFLFWFLLAVAGIVQFRSEIRQFESQETKTASYGFVSYTLYYCLVLLMFILNCFADQAPRFSKYAKVENPCPEEGSSFLSRLLFAWFDSLAWTGFRKPLETKDLWAMKPEDCAPEVVPLFDKYWRRTVEECGSNPAQASYTSDSARVDFQSTNKKKKQASILPALCKAFGPTFMFGAFLKLLQDLLTFVSPEILKLLISFIEGNQSMWKGYLYAVLMLITAMVQTLILSQYFNRMFLVGLRIRTALISAIYRKAMCMSNSARKENTVGEIVNLMSVDAQRFIELTAYLNMIWSAPLQIALALYFLWNTLGPSVLAGLAVMIFLIPINGYIANKVKTLQIRQMKNKDERVKLMNEVLSGIKVLKLYAWEPSFEAQILKIRNKEIKVLKQAAYMNAATSFIWSCAPFLVSLVSFATYVLVDEANVLDAKKAFVSLSLFNILRFPLSMLPMMISNMVQASVSIQRINKFMNSEELNPDNLSHDPSEKYPLVIENGTFSWGEEPILRNINLHFPKADLTAVVGSVGSGKSSLISAFLGEMEKQNGRVNTVGSVAYVSQQAWIQNATLQDNILFGKSLDQKLYDRIIEACSLKPDLEMLPGGDQTEIGEKGINLSGGQKQRVSLARAVYNDADVYFFDDPLSAVDSHVGKHIFENVLGPNGILKKKTRVLVTHGITYLPECNNIVVLKNGEVSEMGSYKELLDKKGDFADFLIQHLQEVNEEEAEEQLDELKSHLGTDEIRQKLARHRSRVSESVSETGSAAERMNGSLTRQMSSDSGDKSGSLRRRIPSAKDEIKKPVKGEKLIEAEKTETGSVKWEVYSHYLKSIGVALSITTVVLNMVFQGFSIGSNMWLSVWSDDQNINVNGTVNTAKRDMYLGVYGALGIGQAFASFFCDLAPQLGCWFAARAMHLTMLAGIMRAPLVFFETTPQGRLLARFSKDIDVLDTGLPQQISDTIYCCFEVVATLFVISYTTPIFVAVIVPIGFVYYFIQRFYVASSRQLKRLESVSRSPIYSHFGESVTGTQTIRAYGVQNRFIDESEAKVDFNQVCYYPSIIANRWLAVRLEMVGNLIIFFAALFAVINKQSMNPGLVGLSVSYALQITQTLNWLVRMTSEVETNIVAVERIKEYGETEQEAPWELTNSTLKSSWPESGTVQFKDYAVRYRPGLDLILKGVNFTVNGGEKVGIVGRTGAGKSSLTLGLFRIIEAAHGAIHIDDVNIAQLGLHALRSRLTIIPQDAVLFSGTLRLNLDPFDTHTDEEVWRALEHAHLKTFVKGLPSGLNHEVTEGGENLSVGQRQLICLGRALLRKTKVLVLDEATAAVDLETDDLIQRTIRTEFNECTVLTIAHRLNTIMDSDRVIVLDKGQIVEFDAPNTLLQDKNSIFYGMAKDAGIV
ncbi:Multidrug-Resistance like Protein 1 [Carabus blaptoides fortunei]